MSIIQIIVPITPSQVYLLENCLESIKGNTPTDHVVNIAVGNAHLEDKVGEIVACARGTYPRTGLVITTCDPSLGYNGVVMEVLRQSDFPYTMILPASHRIEDAEWFGKMQLPHVRAPGCGMTFAFDDMAANTRNAHPWDWKFKVPAKTFMLQRAVIGSAREAAIDSDGDDISSAIRDKLHSVATKCWAVPSCRISMLSTEVWK